MLQAIKIMYFYIKNYQGIK